MGMIMGMGHWLLWAVLGIIAIFALISMVGWMRREKQQGIDNTQDGAETLANITNEPMGHSSGMSTKITRDLS